MPDAERTPAASDSPMCPLDELLAVVRMHGGLPSVGQALARLAQVLFLESDEVCETSYKDKGGKYQGQTGVTLPKT